MSDINEVRERLAAAAEQYAGPLNCQWMATDLRALLADHARLQADADRIDLIETEFLKIEAVTVRASEDDADAAWVISQHQMGRGWVELHQSHDDNLRRAIDAAKEVQS